MDVVAGKDAELEVGGGELTIAVPGSAIDGNGALVATPVVDDRGAEGWGISMVDGAALIGEATLRFHVALTPGEPAPIVSYVADDDGAVLTAVAEAEVDGDAVVVRTDHFSNWFVTPWESIRAAALEALDALYRGTAAAPKCGPAEELVDAGYSVSGLRDGEAVLGCVGFEGDIPTVKLANNRGYTLGFESTPGLTVSRSGADSLLEKLASLLRERPQVDGNSVTLVGPGEHIEYEVSGSRPVAVTGRPSVPGYLVTAAQYAVETIGFAASRVSGHVNAQRLSEAVDWEACIVNGSDIMTADISTVKGAIDVLQKSLGMMLSCVQETAAGEIGDFFGRKFVEGLTWLISGVQTAVNGLSAAAETAMVPYGHWVHVVPPASIPGLPADLAGVWCTVDDDECFDPAEWIERMPSIAVDHASPSERASGATSYTLCPPADCSTASTVYLDYFPVGVEWECSSFVMNDSWERWPGCDPDYTGEHDLSQPRLVVQMNHQQAPDYIDSRPLYQR